MFEAKSENASRAGARPESDAALVVDALVAIVPKGIHRALDRRRKTGATGLLLLSALCLLVGCSEPTVMSTGGEKQEIKEQPELRKPAVAGGTAIDEGQSSAVAVPDEDELDPGVDGDTTADDDNATDDDATTDDGTNGDESGSSRPAGEQADEDNSDEDDSDEDDSDEDVSGRDEAIADDEAEQDVASDAEAKSKND